MTLSSDFQNSYLNFINYPENLIPKGTTTYRSTLASYKQRLDDCESDLCLVDGEDDIDNDFEIPIRDLCTASGKAIDKRNIHSPDELTQWLGVTVIQDPVNAGHKIVTVQKRDPKCRFIYIYAEHARDQLKTTRSSITQLLTFHQVMPVYLDFMLVFGAQSDPKDLRFSGFREQSIMQNPPRGPTIPELDRSGRHFQMCYNLKGVTFKKKSDESIKLDEWSIRQAAVYHQFDVVFGTTLWIVTKGRIDIQQRYKELTGPDGRPEDKSFATLEECFRSSLAAHLLYCHWSTEDWRWYIRWLERVIDAESSMAIYGPRGPGYAHKEYRPYHIQDLQYWQDKTNEAVMVIEANVEVIKALRRFYINLKVHKDFPTTLKNACSDDLSTFVAHLDEIIDDFGMQISRTKLLAKIISDRKELVLQHLQGQAAERTEQLNLNLEREAIVMRIVTIVTLIYLPATFVSTFFSTDVVKYQNQSDASGGSNDGSFSSLALKRWLQVTLPLTAITLAVAWSTYKISETARSVSHPPKTLRNPPGPNIPMDHAQLPQESKRPIADSSQHLSRWQSIQQLMRGWKMHGLVSRLSWRRPPTLPLHQSSQSPT
ncbi:uncharacterized protein BDR25DRAFT_249788 [Lindgomyces ingoldianus]|uniref:Uncharacterized protein n=1 Tax=Lindgomyces ingoldianus TaxID=673940 RepID=A0ACB6RFW0_9PLEO|nr:uncharacterized protein BDR25DRAFT_249788 [Lindgomyces ingoldianus]KAF2477653.1 hypothetical protein BDR25DRAFT_249788 [Lindgomyces ingoldianus]